MEWFHTKPQILSFFLKNAGDEATIDAHFHVTALGWSCGGHHRPRGTLLTAAQTP